MQLIDYIDPDCIQVSPGIQNKESTLRTMVELVSRGDRVRDQDKLMIALQQREEVVSTGIGNSVAIPHADLPEVREPCLALGVFPDGVDFDSLDEEPVYVVFLLLGTPSTPGLHMKILARIARLSKDPEFADGLRQAQEVEEVLERLAHVEAKH